MNSLAYVDRALSFRGVYYIATLAAFLFLILSARVESLWPFSLVFGMVLVYYDMDFVSRVKERKAPFRAMGYFVLIALVFLGVGVVFIITSATGLLFLVVGVVLAGPGFYFYRRSRIVKTEYGS